MRGARAYVDNGVMVIPAHMNDHDALHSVLDALADGLKFMIDDRRPSRSRSSRRAR